MVEIAESEPDIDFKGVKFNADEHTGAGVQFHTLSLPIPQEEYARRVLGDQLDIVVGTGKMPAGPTMI